MARDTSRFIESSIRDVVVDILLGGFLAVMVTLAFLRSLAADTEWGTPKGRSFQTLLSKAHPKMTKSDHSRLYEEFQNMQRSAAAAAPASPARVTAA